MCRLWLSFILFFVSAFFSPALHAEIYTVAQLKDACSKLQMGIINPHFFKDDQPLREAIGRFVHFRASNFGTGERRDKAFALCLDELDALLASGSCYSDAQGALCTLVSDCSAFCRSKLEVGGDAREEMFNKAFNPYRHFWWFVGVAVAMGGTYVIGKHIVAQLAYVRLSKRERIRREIKRIGATLRGRMTGTVILEPGDSWDVRSTRVETPVRKDADGVLVVDLARRVAVAPPGCTPRIRPIAVPSYMGRLLERVHHLWESHGCGRTALKYGTTTQLIAILDKNGYDISGVQPLSEQYSNNAVRVATWARDVKQDLGRRKWWNELSLATRKAFEECAKSVTWERLKNIRRETFFAAKRKLAECGSIKTLRYNTGWGPLPDGIKNIGEALVAPTFSERMRDLVAQTWRSMLRFCRPSQRLASRWGRENAIQNAEQFRMRTLRESHSRSRGVLSKVAYTAAGVAAPYVGVRIAESLSSNEMTQDFLVGRVFPGIHYVWEANNDFEHLYRFFLEKGAGLFNPIVRMIVHFHKNFWDFAPLERWQEKAAAMRAIYSSGSSSFEELLHQAQEETIFQMMSAMPEKAQKRELYDLWVKVAEKFVARELLEKVIPVDDDALVFLFKLMLPVVLFKYSFNRFMPDFAFYIRHSVTRYIAKRVAILGREATFYATDLKMLLTKLLPQQGPQTIDAGIERLKTADGNIAHAVDVFFNGDVRARHAYDIMQNAHNIRVLDDVSYDSVAFTTLEDVVCIIDLNETAVRRRQRGLAARFQKKPGEATHEKENRVTLRAK